MWMMYGRLAVRIVNRSDSIAISIHVYGVGEDKITTGVNRIYPMPA